MNGDHAETVTLMARRLLKLRGKGWAMTAVDPDGCDLTRGDRVARLPFDQALTDVSQLRGALMDLAARTKNDNTETA